MVKAVQDRREDWDPLAVEEIVMIVCIDGAWKAKRQAVSGRKYTLVEYDNCVLTEHGRQRGKQWVGRDTHRGSINCHGESKRRLECLLDCLCHHVYVIIMGSSKDFI